MIEAWRDACVMGTEREENKQTSGGNDASQEDTASVSKIYLLKVALFL